jgi:tRNA(His) guanylyltransferase
MTEVTHEPLKLSLGQRMKKLEIDSNRIPPYQSYIVRADGHSFSKYTNGFKKPFDQLFINAILRTSNHLLEIYSGSTIAYCSSDEISIIIPRICTKEEYDQLVKSGEQLPTHYASGRVTKIETFIAAKCSVIFNKYINEEIESVMSEYKQNIIDKIVSSEATFDARIILIPIGLEIELVNNIIWRSNYDCLRNTISAYGRYKLGHKKTLSKNGEEQIQLMKEIDFDFATMVPDYIKYGILSKKIQITMNDESGKEYIRTKIYNFSSNLITEDKQNVLDLFLSKYFEPDLINITEYNLI